MIVEVRGDVVWLEGHLESNLWPAIKAAVNLSLKRHPKGIILDCSRLLSCSDEGVITFVHAMDYIHSCGARILICDVPSEILEKIKQTPGVRSQLPIAKTLDEARASLNLETMFSSSHETKAMSADRQAEKILLVPVLEILDVSRGVSLARELAGDVPSEIHLVYFLEVPKALPLGAPLPEAEALAQKKLQDAEALFLPPDKKQSKKAGEQKIILMPHVERTREVSSGILNMAKQLKASIIIISTRTAPDMDNEQLELIVSTLLLKAPCEVLIDRMTPS